MRRSLTARVGAESALQDIAEDSIVVSNNPDTKEALGLPQSDEALSECDAMEIPLEALRTAPYRSPGLKATTAVAIDLGSRSLAHARRRFAATLDGHARLASLHAGERSSGIRVR